MRRLLPLLAAALLVPGALRGQAGAPLKGRLEGDTYFSATGEFSVPVLVLRELGGTVTDTENVVTFSDRYSTHISIACFPQDALQRWERDTRGTRDYLLYFFTEFVLADFNRRYPGSAIESARFIPELMEGALVAYALLPGGSHFEPTEGIAAPPPEKRATARRGTLLFVRDRHVYVLSTELPPRATQTEGEGGVEQDNAQLTARLTELTGRLVFPPQRSGVP